MDRISGLAARRQDADRANVSLAIGCFAAICRDQLGDRLVAFARAWASVDLGVHEMPLGELLAGVRDGTLALAVLPGGPREGLHACELMTDRAMVAMAPSHRLAALAEVPVRALVDERLLVPRQRHDAELHRFLARQVAPLTRLNGALCGLDQARPLAQVAAGEAIALTCESQRLDPDAGVVLRPLAAAGARFPVSAYWREAAPRWPLSALIAALAPA